MNEKNESFSAQLVLLKAFDCALIYSEEHDREASMVAVLVRAIELATGRSVNMEKMYDIRND
jgi:hypothetical protein